MASLFVGTQWSVFVGMVVARETHSLFWSRDTIVEKAGGTLSQNRMQRRKAAEEVNAYVLRFDRTHHRAAILLLLPGKSSVATEYRHSSSMPTPTPREYS
jgi:hypothetical protein